MLISESNSESDINKNVCYIINNIFTSYMPEMFLCGEIPHLMPWIYMPVCMMQVVLELFLPVALPYFMLVLTGMKNLPFIQILKGMWEHCN